MSSDYYRPAGFNLLPPVIKNLLIINGLLFVATMVFEQRLRIDLNHILGFHYFTSEYFMPHQFFTYMFMHGNFAHIFFNMFALWMFGNMLENTWGAKRFFIFYTVCGIGAVLCHAAYTWFTLQPLYDFVNAPSLETFRQIPSKEFRPGAAARVIAEWSENPAHYYKVNILIEQIKELIVSKSNIPVVGASGSVFGILLAFGMLYPNTYIYLYLLFPIKAKWFVIIYGAIELFSGVAALPGDNVAHFAHLGGMLFGFLLIKYWSRR